MLLLTAISLMGAGAMLWRAVERPDRRVPALASAVVMLLLAASTYWREPWLLAAAIALTFVPLRYRGGNKSERLHSGARTPV